MRIQISHETVYRYEAPAAGVIQTLRLNPRNHEGQYVVDWRIDLSENCQLDQHEDAFGNITHVFTAEGPFEELRVLVEGEVDTQDTKTPRLAIVELAHTERSAVDAFLERQASSRRAAKIRKVALLLARLAPGETLLVSEFSRLGRSVGGRAGSRTGSSRGLSSSAAPRCASPAVPFVFLVCGGGRGPTVSGGGGGLWGGPPCRANPKRRPRATGVASRRRRGLPPTRPPMTAVASARASTPAVT